jgi:uncharacterized protein involved in outer membrane biogenesis
MHRLRRILWRLLPLVVLLLVAAAVASTYILRNTSMLRDRVVAALNQRFQSQVQLGSLEIAAFPRPEIRGSRLELRHNGRTDVPPLITVREFSGGAGVFGLLETPLHIRSVTLDGLNIQIPPGGMSLSRSPSGAAEPAPAPAETGRSRRRPSLVIDRIEAGSAWLEMASRNPLKPPRVFDIHQLVMTGFRPDAAAEFTAKLTNPMPEGEIETTGSFGPWIADRPRETRLQGKYTFERAQLDDIKGLGGTLASTGTYQGSLERVAVRGETVSPDFALDIAHQPVSLNTRFTAVVDATNGDTYLEQVHATLVSTVIEASGQIVRARDVQGDTSPWTWRSRKGSWKICCGWR